MYAMISVSALKFSILCPLLSQWDCPSPSTGVTGTCPHTSFYVGAGDLNPGLHAVKQVL